MQDWDAPGLNKATEPDAIQKFLKKDGKTASQFIRLSFPLLLLFITCSYTEYLYPIIGIGQDLSINTLQASLVFLLTIFVLGSFLCSSIEKSIDSHIDRLEVYPNFLITKGDQNAVKEFEDKNNKLTKQIFGKVIWILFSVLVSYTIRFLITYFSPLKH